MARPPSPVALAALALLGCEPSRPAPDTRPASSDRTQTVAEVAWPAQAPDPSLLSAVDEASRASVARSPVPVLLPARAELLARGKVMVGEHWYAFSGKEDGRTVSVQGTRLAHRYEGIAPVRGPHTLRGAPGFVTRNEQIWSASWSEHGVAYTVDVECDRPDDARCATEATVRDVVDALAFAGGRGGAR